MILFQKLQVKPLSRNLRHLPRRRRAKQLNQATCPANAEKQALAESRPSHLLYSSALGCEVLELLQSQHRMSGKALSDLDICTLIFRWIPKEVLPPFYMAQWEIVIEIPVEVTNKLAHWSGAGLCSTDVSVQQNYLVYLTTRVQPY